jgi:RNA polymerase sigma-70 factor, ECF subfamily
VVDRAQLDRWMADAADGDRAAVEPLFHALRPVVTGYAERVLGDRALADDVAQEALIKLFGQLARYDRSRDALTWTLTIATWECRTARRARSRRGEISAVVERATEPDDPQLVRAALAVLAELAPRDIEVIAASILDDDAARAGLAPATFRKRLERALARLRLSWRSRHGTL